MSKALFIAGSLRANRTPLGLASSLLLAISNRCSDEIARIGSRLIPVFDVHSMTCVYSPSPSVLASTFLRARIGRREVNGWRKGVDKFAVLLLVLGENEQEKTACTVVRKRGVGCFLE